MRNHYSSRPPSSNGRNVARPTKDDTIEARIGRKVKVQPDGCWLFRGKLNTYGQFPVRSGGTTHWISVHRHIYEIANGPIADGHHVHHECETPGCCNPLYLIALTPAEHAARHREMRQGAA